MLWRAGAIVFVLGNLINFSSFAFAAQSLLAALGSVQFVSNVVFSYLILKEPITFRAISLQQNWPQKNALRSITMKYQQLEQENSTKPCKVKLIRGSLNLRKLITTTNLNIRKLRGSTSSQKLSTTLTCERFGKTSMKQTSMTRLSIQDI